MNIMMNGRVPLKRSEPEAIVETIRANHELSDAFQRCREHLRANGVDLGPGGGTPSARRRVEPRAKMAFLGKSSVFLLARRS